MATVLVISSRTTFSLKDSGRCQLLTNTELGVGLTNITFISSIIGTPSTKESSLFNLKALSRLPPEKLSAHVMLIDSYSCFRA